MKLLKQKVLPIIMQALSEDIGSGDITTSLVFEKDWVGIADIVVREECVVAGIDIAKWIFNVLDEKIIFKALCSDGERIKRGKRVVSVKGSIKSILTAERTVLNFIGRLSGIATLTDRFSKKIKGTKAKILDTRKTTPGLRVLEKYAVRVGGGHNHRMGLWDGVLIKDNHLEGVRFQAYASVNRQSSRQNITESIVTKARAKGYKNIEIEVNDLKEYKDALRFGADIIMLDNMEIEDIKKAVKLKSPGVLLEVSGGVSLENVTRIAKTGVDRISIGSLTHSAPSIDFSLEINHS